MAPKALKQKKYAKPQEPHIIIFNPWGMPNSNRQKRDIDAFGAWIRHMFRGLGQPSCVVEAVYMMSTRTEVIVALSGTVDIVPVLGEHKWSKFLKSSFLEAPPTERSLMRWGSVLSEKFLYSVRAPGVRASGTSLIFEYNWERCGDPSERQWESHFAVPDDPPEEMDFPVRRDYPNPSWADPPPGLQSNTRCLLLPLPSSRTKTPPPVEVQDEDHASLSPQPVKAEPEVKMEQQGSASGQRCGISEMVKQEQAEETKPFQKQDPYEEESTARQSLFDAEEETNVKMEPRDVKPEAGTCTYQFNEALLQMIEQQQLEMHREQEQGVLDSASTTERAIPDSSSATYVKKEFVDNLSRTTDPRKRSLAPDMLETNKRIKREA